MRLALLTVLFAACGTTTPDTGATNCDDCLASGGTWQPEAQQCTTDCDLMDISCFADECPGECEADACGNCFSQPECEAATCTWTTIDESMFCQ